VGEELLNTDTEKNRETDMTTPICASRSCPWKPRVWSLYAYPLILVLCTVTRGHWKQTDSLHRRQILCIGWRCYTTQSVTHTLHIQLQQTDISHMNNVLKMTSNIQNVSNIPSFINIRESLVPLHQQLDNLPLRTRGFAVSPWLNYDIFASGTASVV
jgi:hypothetical protein